MKHIRRANVNDCAELDRLLEVWETAVRATHHFLSEEDIIELRPAVATALASVPSLHVWVDEDLDAAQGFLGLDGEKIEMLFVHDEARGKGIGKQLVEYAVRELGATLVDVNEQNPQGVGFYCHMGFVETGRSETDEQGRPFPILHLKLQDS